MKTLVIHPSDPSTDFLKVIYNDMQDKTVLSSYRELTKVKEEMQKADRIICLGHGTPSGLMGGMTGYAVTSEHISLMQGKECIFIWCNADMFARKSGMSHAYATGMIISEVIEANYCNVKSDKEEINKSNKEFANAVRLGVMSDDIEKTILDNYLGTSELYLFNRDSIAQY